MASFTSVLQKIGIAFKDIFKVATDVATVAEPIVDIAFPGVATLYNMTVALVSSAEVSAAAAGAQNGTGPQKLALVLSALEPYLAQEAGTLGIAAPTTAQVTAYINAIVASLNAFGAAA